MQLKAQSLKATLSGTVESDIERVLKLLSGVKDPQDYARFIEQFYAIDRTLAQAQVDLVRLIDSILIWQKIQ